MEEYLKGDHYIQIELSLASNFKEAQRQCEEKDFDLILLDLNLPDSDGLETLISMKKNTPLIPTVVLTGFSDEEMGIEAIRRGAQDYIKKGELGPSLLRRIIRHSIERKEMEMSLERAAQAWRNTFDAIPDLVYVLDENHIILRANQAMADFAGVHPKELIGRPCCEIFHQTDHPNQDCPLHKACKDQKTCHQEICEASGNKPFEITVSPIFEEGKKATKYVHVARDLSFHKKMEQSLFESEMRFLTAIQASPFPAMIHSEDGKVLMISESWTELSGYTEKDLTTLSDWTQRAYGPEKGKETLKTLQRLYTLQEKTHEGESEITTKKGEKRIWDFSSAPLGKNAEEKGLVLTIAVDITEKKKAEAKLRQSQAMLHQSQKMEAIGRLAGGVAHDFNNLLTVIIGGSEMLLMNESLSQSLWEEVSSIQEAGKQAASLTRQLLAFSRQDTTIPEVIHLNDLIRTTEKMLGRIIGENITLVTSFQMELHPIRIDPGQIQQILLNLAINSRDAMPEGGIFRIQTENYTLQEPLFFEGRKAPEGEYVSLVCEDQGVGISPKILTSIFEPFFSTKEKGKGTGLGLAVVYGIVKQNRGWINVFSRVNKGTTFKIFFPACLESPSKEKARERPSPKNLQPGANMILLVEDEGQSREFVTRALQKESFIVIPASYAEEALALYKREHENIGLLFSDIVLPDKNGVWLAEEILKRNPNLKILFSSGYADQPSQWQSIRDKGYPFLRKPYFIADLIKTLKEMINQ